MSKLWGPLGWMMLHSISMNYPDTPSVADKLLASKFLELFAETISCNQCKAHFRQMLTMYTDSTPDFLSSRRNFALFVFRAHNTVNKRLDKPRPATVSECLATLRSVTARTPFPNLRHAYLSYLQKNWGREFTGDGRIMQGLVKDMIKINNEYWSVREATIPDLAEADVITPIENAEKRISLSGTPYTTRVGFKSGRLRLIKL